MKINGVRYTRKKRVYLNVATGECELNTTREQLRRARQAARQDQKKAAKETST